MGAREITLKRRQPAAGLDRLAAARQASEQYFTSSQFLAQARRQVMGRWHTMHSLLGRFCLLPLKPARLASPANVVPLVVDELRTGLLRQGQQGPHETGH